MIDPHVHLRDWNQSSKETIAHGLAVAASLGFTDLFDMPNTSPACTERESILKRLEDAAPASDKTGVRYHIYCGITNDEDQVKRAVEIHSELFPRVSGLKLFAGHSTGNMGIIGIESQRKVFRALKGYRGVLAVHAEKEELIDSSRYIPGRYETHSLARPSIAETESVRDLIALAKETGFEGTLHICHVSAKETIELVRAERQNLRITMGATPHHALLTAEDAEDPGRLLKMNPPLRPEEDRAAVFQALVDGTIDWAESDHAPHTLQDKEAGASGIPGLPGMMLLLSRLGKHCSNERLEALFGGNAMKAFGLGIESVRIPEDPYGLYISARDEYPFDPYRA